VFQRYRHKFNVTDDLYNRYIKTLGSEAEKVLEDLHQTSSFEAEKRSWPFLDVTENPFRAVFDGRLSEPTFSGPNDGTEDLDRTSSPAAHHESPSAGDASFDYKGVQSQAQLFTWPHQAMFTVSVGSDSSQQGTLPTDDAPIEMIEPTEMWADPMMQNLPVEPVDDHRDNGTSSRAIHIQHS
jgi:hypothetical protein